MDINLLTIRRKKIDAVSTQRIFLIKALKMTSAFLLAVITWNFILSVLLYKTPGTIRDNTLGKIYKPGILVNSDEGFSRTKINSLGMRNIEVASKGPNEKRILILGDSYTEGIHVSDDNLYTVKLEKDLIKELNKTISVVNSGRSGASPANYIYLSEFYNSKISSDYTVIQTSDSDWSIDIFNKEQNFYVNEENGRFKVVFNNYLSSSPLLKKVPELSFILKFNELPILSYANVKIKQLKQPQSSAENGESFKDLDAKRLERISDWTIKELKNRYPNIVFLYMPTIDYNKPSEDYTPIEKLIKAKCDEYGIDFIDVRKEFLNYYTQNKQPAYGFNNTTPGIGHMNKIGHSIVADSLKQYFMGRIK